jgi:hypothetical protein
MKLAASECQRKTSNIVSVLHCQLKACVTTCVDSSVLKQLQHFQTGSDIPTMFTTVTVTKVYSCTNYVN